MDTDALAELLSDLIDALPTEATFRTKAVCVRLGESPKTREMIIAGFNPKQTAEVLMKVDDAYGTEPTPGEILTIASKGYKIGTVTPLLSLSEPAGYRLTIDKVI